jgi:predicted RNase H-like HicB family nuclease
LEPYLAVIEPDDGRYRACCPVLGDCTVTGATYDEAKTRLMELVRHRLTDLRAAGQPLPRERGRIERLPVAAWLVEAAD